MKNLKILILPGLVLMGLLASCDDDNDLNQSVDTVAEDTEQVYDEFTIVNKEGIQEKGILIGGDAFISYDHLKELEKSKDDSQKLRMKRDRVNMCKGKRFGNGPRRNIIINVKDFNNRARQATIRAANYFNGRTNGSDKFGIKFSVINGNGSGRSGDIIYCSAGNVGDSFAIGYLPRGGDPGSSIILNRAFMQSGSPRDIENIMIHEIGHTLGFVHSDWNGRQSCSRRRVENVANTFFVFWYGDASNGKNPVSVMSACGTSRPTLTDNSAFFTAYRKGCR